MQRSAIAVVVGLLSLAVPARSADVRTETVRFESGASSARIQGGLKGDETVHYLVRAREGQQMTVRLTEATDSAYFNVFAPGNMPGKDEAMYIGSVGGAEFAGRLPVSGDYLIQVYQVRSAARRGEAAKFKLEIAIDAQDQPSIGDAKVPGTDFEATGELPCARYEAQPMGSCRFGVRRLGGGDAEVTIFWPDGGTRVVRFEKGAPRSSDATGKLIASKKVDLFFIRIGSERFEIVEAIVTGG